jgi:hypothetical protein
MEYYAFKAMMEGKHKKADRKWIVGNCSLRGGSSKRLGRIGWKFLPLRLPYPHHRLPYNRQQIFCLN